MEKFFFGFSMNISCINFQGGDITGTLSVYIL